MATTLKLANTSSELNEIMALRVRALNALGLNTGPVAKLSGRLTDALDLDEGVLNFVGFSGPKAVASVRLSPFRPDEILQNHPYELSKIVQRVSGKFVYADYWLQDPALPAIPDIQQHLLSFAWEVAFRRDYTHMISAIDQSHRAWLEKMGAQAAFTKGATSDRVIPFTIDLREIGKRTAAQVRDKEILRFSDVFYKTIFQPGEIIALQGEKGSTAYLIEEGEVEVLVQSTGGSFVSLNRLGRGHLIGEVAMVTGEPRTASVIAASVVSCMSFDRRDFMEAMYQEPQKALDIFKILSRRLADSNQKLAERSPS
jgi:hypothetical protein